MTIVNGLRNLPSLEYWREPPERIPQRFYVAICLLMSSVQDAFLGMKEKESNNLNWSATCSYYSLVHAGRLLCFLALGDYPTQHNRLQHIFSASHQQRRNTSSHQGRTTSPHQDGYPFDWLRTFAARTGGQPPQAASSQGGGGPTLNFRQMIAAYFNQVHVTDSEERLTKYGNALAAAAPLRNDSNYETLLIAHEYQHVAMSEAFSKLSLRMATAAESTLPLLVDAFNGFRFHDPDLQERRDQYEAFLHAYVHKRIGVAIRRKLGVWNTLEMKLEEVLRRIGTRDTDAKYHDL